MKHLSLLLILLSSILVANAQNILFKETFDNIAGPTAGGAGTYAFPTGWTLANVDNKVPHSSVSYVNEAWERREDFGLSVVDSCAFSNSYYSPVGQADDWMWTPAITLTGSGAFTLNWNARSYDGLYKDAYEVRLMTAAPTGSTGNMGNMLSSTLLLDVPAENAGAWINRSIDLGAWAGQTVYIGFRNISVDKYLLAIDDVQVTSDNSLHFDGTNDRVQVPDHNSLDLIGSYTIECWIKPDAFSALAGLVSKYNTPGSNGYTLRLSNSAPYTGLNFDEMSTPNGVLQAGRWYHIAAVNNAGVRKLYINGVEQTLTGSPLTVVANTDVLSIGADYVSSPRYFNGNIDEIRLWNVARTQVEVQASMNTTLNMPTTGLVAYYPFAQGVSGANNTSVTTLADVVSGNNGTLSGFTLTGNTSNWAESYARVYPATIAASGITANSFTANWAAPQANTATDYLLDVATDANFTSILASYNGLSTGNVLSYSITGLIGNTNYYFRVRAIKTGVGQSILSNTTTLTTLVAPPPPVITSFAPASAAPGGSVVITGSGFNTTPASNVVFFGTVKTTVTAATAISLTVNVPVNAAYGAIKVLNTATGLSVASTQYFTPVFSPNKPGLIPADMPLQSVITHGILRPRIFTLASGDLNDDGKPDLVMTSGWPNDPNVYFRRNTSTSTTISFGTADSVGVPGGLLMADGQISIGDLDGDARPDVVVPGNQANAFAILKNNGSMNFTSTTVANGTGTRSSSIADFDKDGKPDVAIGNASNIIRVYPNTSAAPGSLTLGSAVTLTGTTQNTFIVTADLDGDGREDIIAANGTWYTLSVFRNTSSTGAVSFAAEQVVTVFSINHAPGSIAVADLNGDNKPDLIVTDDNFSNATSFAVLQNTSTTGNISFTTTMISLGAAPYSQSHASVGDLNGDGKPDIILSLAKDFGGPTATRYRIAMLANTSSGGIISLASPIELNTTVASMPNANHVVSDFNGDGIPDIVVSHPTTAHISIFKGNPQFAPVVTAFTPATAATGTSINITGTGFGSTPANNTVYFGATKGTVTAASSTSLTVTVPSGAIYAPITVLNKSNLLQAASLKNFLPAFAPNKTTLAATDFTVQSNITATGSNIYGLVTGDLTGDGKPDIVQTDDVGHRLVIYPNATATSGDVISYGTPAAISLTGILPQPRYPSVADIDGDGWLDIIVPSPQQDSVGIMLNPGTGAVNTFAVNAKFKTGALPVGTAVGDLDGDGKADIVTSNYYGSSVSILRNTSTATGTVSFAEKQDITIPPGTQATYYVTLADVDNDGKPDIITERDVNSNPGFIVVYRNTSTIGNISFAAAVEFPSLQAPWAIVPGDIDGDGLTDLAVSHGGSTATSVSVFRNTTSGSVISFTRSDYNVQSEQRTLVLGDMNGDGKTDVVTVTNSAVSGNYFTSILPNTSTSGNVSFGTRLDLPASLAPWTTLVADMNSDGRPDIVTGINGASTRTLTVYRNTLVAAPLTQATNIVVNPLSSNTATLTWTNGSGEKRAVFIKADNTGTPSPANGTDYTANAQFTSGTQIGSTGWYCVYKGTGNSVALTGLISATAYRAMVIEFNDNSLPNVAQYKTTTATGNPVNFTTSPPLPVTLISFKAFEKNLKVELEWNVANEVNVAVYEIERSGDAASFEKIGAVAASGSTTYNWTDVSPLKGINYYRLKMKDKDGASRYSSILMVRSNPGKNVFTIVNPVIGKNISFILEGIPQGKYTMRVLNSAGQQVAMSSIHYAGASISGTMQLPLAIKGICLIVLKGDDLLITQRVVVD